MGPREKEDANGSWRHRARGDGTIETDIPARLDRLPWSRFHWRPSSGWERCGSLMASRSRSSGRSPGACRKRAPESGSRRATSPINSAIDELIPAKYRGHADISINGSYWGGAIGGSLLALVALNTSIFPADVGWRLCFGRGAILGLGVLLIRRTEPESPRWLFIHGHEDEAEKVVGSIEREVSEQTGQELPPPKETITVRQRRTIPPSLIVRSVVTLYPKRTVLGLALFVSQAFLYNAVLFSLGYLLKTCFGVSSGDAPYYIAVFAVGNLLGPLTLGRLFDTVGRKPMIAGTYLLSGVLLAVMAFLFKDGQFTLVSFMVMLGVIFFFASAGVSAAYLTVSEIFPLETRALCIAVFYAVGTGAGGIVGPLLFAHLIESGKLSQIFVGFMIGAVAMIIGGIAELLVGAKAERVSLESIARALDRCRRRGRLRRHACAGDRCPVMHVRVWAPASTVL
jgi:MFS family permease